MKRLVLLVLSLLVLAGCVHYEEELWLNRDGSGRAKLRLVHRSPYENPEEILRKAALPGISLQKYDIQRQGADAIYTIEFKFKSIEAFNNVNDQLGAADFWGKITLNKEPGRRITFKRRIALGSPESDDEFENIYSRMQTENKIWSYKLHVPWKIVTSNAKEEDIDHKNHTLAWNFDTNAMWNKHEYMTAEFKKSFPWIFVFIGVVVLLLTAFLIHWLFRFAKKSHLIERLTHHDNKTED
jgi:hypothetical protein